MSSFLRALAVELLSSKIELELPEPPQNFSEEAADFTVKRVVWWILKNKKDPPTFSVTHPELHDEEEATINGQLVTPVALYDELDLPHVRAESDTETPPQQDDENGGRVRKKIKSSKIYLEEVVGAGILEAKIRKFSTEGIKLLESETETGDFVHVFESSPETDYTKGIVSGICQVCKEHLDGKKKFENHLNSDSHKKNFRNLSLDVGNSQYEEYVHIGGNNTLDQIDVQASIKVYDPKDPVTVGIPPRVVNKWRISPEEKAEFLRSINIGDYDIPEDHPQNDAKLKLRFANKWTNALDKKWIKMKAEEKKLIDEYKALRTNYLADPSSHPFRAKEWSLFWERRRLELIKEGVDPDNYNYHPEWCKHWLKQLLDLLKSDAELKISHLKGSMGMDAYSLKHLFDEPVNGRVRAMPGVGGSRTYNSRNTYQIASSSRYSISNSYHPPSLQRRGAGAGGRGDTNNYSSSYHHPYLSPYPPPAQYRYAHHSNGHFSHSHQQIYYDAYNNYGFPNQSNPNPHDVYYYGYYY